MTKKNLYDSLPKDIQQKTGFKTGYDAFRFVYSNDAFRQQKAAEMGFVEVRPRVFEKPKTVNILAPQKKVLAPQKKYASIGKAQMRSGRYPTIKTKSTGLTSQAKIFKKTLLGE